MLSQGKLFEAQDRPMFVTTLESMPKHRPFLAKKAVDKAEVQILWARSLLKGNAVLKEKPEKDSAYFLAFRAGIVNANEEAILYVQVVMKDNSSLNFYLHYLPI